MSKSSNFNYTAENFGNTITVLILKKKLGFFCFSAQLKDKYPKITLCYFLQELHFNSSSAHVSQAHTESVQTPVKKMLPAVRAV